MEASKITEIMDRIEELPYRKIIFDGKWGIGKTKHIMDSIMYKENIYYVSLFGKKDITSFYEELYYLLVSDKKIQWEKLKRNIEKINFSKLGFNISIPLISDIFVNIQKELVDTQNITIVIDDIERRKDNLDIKEIFGFVDSITKMENIKVVLVASSDNFTETTKKAFDDYNEKSLDRIYKITNYSKDAPQNIVGEDIWPIIKNIYQETGFQNLRTLDKASLFVKEVMNEISNEIFNQKVTKADIYKICFAVVIFTIDYKNTMQPLTEGETKMFSTSYNSEEKIPDYIWQYILKRNLNNSRMHNFISIFYTWYSTGEFRETEFKQTLDLVNTYFEVEHPLFLSDEEILTESTNYSTFINNIGENISFNNFMKRLDELSEITEKTNLTFNFTEDEVVDWIAGKDEFKDVNSTIIFDNFFRKDSKFVKNIIPKLKKKVTSQNKEEIIDGLQENMRKTNFKQSDIDKTRNLKNYFMNSGKTDKLDLIIEIKNNDWFFPLPKGKITDSHWTYCHSIFTTIQDIDRQLEDSVLDELKEYCEREISKSSDEIFKYRLRHLVKQYLTGF